MRQKLPLANWDYKVNPLIEVNIALFWSSRTYVDELLCKGWLVYSSSCVEFFSSTTCLKDRCSWHKELIKPIPTKVEQHFGQRPFHHIPAHLPSAWAAFDHVVDQTKDRWVIWLGKGMKLVRSYGQQPLCIGSSVCTNWEEINFLSKLVRKHRSSWDFNHDPYLDIICHSNTFSKQFRFSSSEYL